MARKRRYKTSRYPKTGFKTYLLIFMLCGVAAVVLDFLFGVPDKARQFAQDSVDSGVRGEGRAILWNQPGADAGDKGKWGQSRLRLVLSSLQVL